MRKLGIAGLQLDLGPENNIEQIGVEIRAARMRMPWLDLLVLSELCAYGPDVRCAESNGGSAERAFCRFAKEAGVWLIPGSLFVKDNGSVFNEAIAISPDGEIRARYRKIYPWLPYEAGIESGRDFCVFEIEGIGRIGLSVCYDLWFPEVARALAWLGAELILTPSQTNTIDRDVELALVRATAAQNQCFVVNVNGAGDFAAGKSIVCGPGGEILHQSGTSRECFSLEIVFDDVDRCRARGWNGLGQVLKSFRDTPIRFPQYAGVSRSSFLDALGPLVLPKSSLPQR